MHSIWATIFLALSGPISFCYAQTISGRAACTSEGGYTLCQNLWGQGSALGSQQSTLIHSDNVFLSWSTKYTWINNFFTVKSFANVESHTAKGVKLKNIQSCLTLWSWDYETRSPGLKANIAYDIWLGIPSNGSAASNASSYEIMIWLASTGEPSPFGSLSTQGISISNNSWDLWQGKRKNWLVYSFVTKEDIYNFNADLNEFLSYLVNQQNVSSQLYIQRIQAGTETFVGSANLVTHNYTVSIKALESLDKVHSIYDYLY